MSGKRSSKRSLSAEAKAEVLASALPWLEEFSGATIVVKYGGHAMTNDDLKRSFAEDIVFLRRVGLRPVVVHGGGPQINHMLDQLDLPAEFRGGLRVTTPEAMQVVRMVLTGQVQRDIVGLINQHGPLAVGMSGEDAHLFTAERQTVDVNGASVDLGLVGEITSVDPGFVETVLDDGLVPVVSSIARESSDDPSEVLNVNADMAAAALAVGLGARKLVMLTDVAGIYADWPSTNDLISEISATEVRSLLPTMDGGMAPKMAACLKAVEGGVGKAHVLDGRIAHALLLEIFTSEGIGTQIVPELSQEPALKVVK